MKRNIPRRKRKMQDRDLSELLRQEELRHGLSEGSLTDSALSVIEAGTSIDRLRWLLMKRPKVKK